MDYYYTVEGPIGKPPIKDEGAKKKEQMQFLCSSFAQSLHRVCRAFSREEQEAVNKILAEFFVFTPEGYSNPRADREIATRKDKAESKKAGGYARWGKDPKEEKRKQRKLSKSIGSHTETEWKMILATYDHRCCKCGASMADTELTKDHIIPFVKGGSDSIDNIQPLCHPCNSGKGGTVKDYRQMALKRIHGIE